MNVQRTMATFALKLAGVSKTAGAPRAGWSVVGGGGMGLLYDMGGGMGTTFRYEDFSGTGGGAGEKLDDFSNTSGSCSALGKTPALQVERLFFRLRRRVLRTTRIEIAMIAIRTTATMPPTALPERPL